MNVLDHPTAQVAIVFSAVSLTAWIGLGLYLVIDERRARRKGWPPATWLGKLAAKVRHRLLSTR